MTPARKLTAYAVILGLALVGGAAGGTWFGPDATPDGAGSDPDVTTPDVAPDAGGDDGGREGGDDMPGGLAVSHDGYTFDPDDTVLDSGGAVPFTFRILGPDGAAVREYVAQHERDLHLIVVSRDLQTFLHVHPSLGADGTWSIDLPLTTPGSYRAYADFAPAGGAPLTLGVDLVVPGEHHPSPLPSPETTAPAGSFEVGLSGVPVAGRDATVEFIVTRAGEPVDLDPYLGARGHLVAIRSGDLAYLHVHPLDDGAERGRVAFAVHAPSAGVYRLFLDFQVDGEVHTAAFTVDVAGAPRTETTDTTGPPPDAGHGAPGHGH